MDTSNPNPETRFALRADSILAYGCGHGCRVRTAGSGQAAELISIGQQWARIRLADGGKQLGHGDTVSLEPGLAQGLPAHIPGRVGGGMGNELWVDFTTPLAVSLHDLQSSLDTCAAA